MPTEKIAVKPKVTTTVKKSGGIKPKTVVKAEETHKTVTLRKTEETEESPSDEVEQKPKRQRPKARPFVEIQDELSADLKSAYKLLQSCVKNLNALKAAHKRDVSHSRNRESTARTPTLFLDQTFVDYFHKRLDNEGFQITRTVAGEKVKVDLSGLDTKTAVHRTDVTQLYCNVFAAHDMKHPDDGRQVQYSKDPELVKLLTTGVTNPELAADVQAIKDSTYELNIFNIQKFTSQYVHKAKPTE